MKKVLVLKENIKSIKNIKQVFDNVRKINCDFEQENFIVLYLDSKNELINSEILFKGGLNSCLVDPKTLFRKALLNNANALIIAHNHPSDDLKPSEDDLNVYENLKKAGKILMLEVIDSIIFNKENYYSLNDWF